MFDKFNPFRQFQEVIKNDVRNVIQCKIRIGTPEVVLNVETETIEWEDNSNILTRAKTSPTNINLETVEWHIIGDLHPSNKEPKDKVNWQKEGF